MKKKNKIVKRHRSKISYRRVSDGSGYNGVLTARGVAREITNSDNVVVRRRRIPAKFVKYVERNVGVKFKKKPQFYTYEPRPGKHFRPKRECGGWDGASVTAYDLGNGKVKGTVVLLPKSHLASKPLKENVLLHELAETLVGQHMIQPHKKRRRTQVSSFEHGFGLAYEKKHLQKHKMTAPQMSALAKKLFNDKESWA
jgi:hypothetical protein